MASLECGHLVDVFVVFIAIGQFSLEQFGRFDCWLVYFFIFIGQTIWR